jgi:hypothetical protein
MNSKTERVLRGREAYIARLKNGETISFRSKGNSMTPRIKSGDKCTYIPVNDTEDISKGDMVYCHVGKYYFTHLVTGIKGSGKDTLFQISNNHGYVNDWIPISQIYGKVIQINGKPV